MRYRIERTKGQYCHFANSRKELLDYLKHAPAGTVMDIHKIHKDVYKRQEQLKAENHMEWVRQMNACKAQAEEVVKAELIYNVARKSGQKTVRTFLR